MKIKRKDKNTVIPITNCYCGLKTEQWVRLNSGKTITVDKVKSSLVDFIVEIEDKPKKEKELDHGNSR